MFSFSSGRGVYRWARVRPSDRLPFHRRENTNRSIIVFAQEHKGPSELSANISSDYALQINYDEDGRRLYDATADLPAAEDNDLISKLYRCCCC